MRVPVEAEEADGLLGAVVEDQATASALVAPIRERDLDRAGELAWWPRSIRRSTLMNSRVPACPRSASSRRRSGRKHGQSSPSSGRAKSNAPGFRSSNAR